MAPWAVLAKMAAIAYRKVALFIPIPVPGLSRLYFVAANQDIRRAFCSLGLVRVVRQASGLNLGAPSWRKVHDIELLL
jgi:hypothetical protein